MEKLFFLLLFIVFQAAFNFSYCQLKDTIRIRDSIRYHLAIATTGSLNQSTNTNTYLMNNTVRFGAARRLFSTNFSGSYVYGSSNHALTNNDVLISVDGNLYQQRSKFFYWILLNYTSSYSLKIKGLFQSGAG